MGNHPSIAAGSAAGALPPALVWGLDGEEELAAASAAAAAAAAAAGASSSSLLDGSSSSGDSTSRSRNRPPDAATGSSGPDFGTLFLEGEPWGEAQHKAAFLSRVQRRLMDPAFVAGLQAEEDLRRRAEEVAADCRERAQVFEQVLAAGAFGAAAGNGGDLLAALKPRLHEDLQATLHPPAYHATLRKRALLLRHLQPRVAAYRSAARRPLLRAPRAPPPPSAEESSLVRLACSMNRVCLVALRAIVQFAGTIPSSTSSSTSSTDFVKLPLLELHVMARAFTPQCFFPDVALPLSPPEEAVPTDAATATASSVDGARTADKALDEQSNSYWSSKKRPGTTLWTVQLAQPAHVSAVTLTFQQSFNSVLAPLLVRVQVCYDPDGARFETVGALRFDSLTSSEAAAPLRIPCPGSNGIGAAGQGKRPQQPRTMAHWVRLQLSGHARFNEQGYYGLKAVTIHQPRADPSYIDVRDVLSSLQTWLGTVSRTLAPSPSPQALPPSSSSPSSTSSPHHHHNDLHTLALSAMERVACASGLLSAVLRFAFALLEEEEEEPTSSSSLGTGGESAASSLSLSSSRAGRPPSLPLPGSASSSLSSRDRAGGEEEEKSVDPALAAATEHLLECVEEEARTAKGKLVQAIAAHPLAPVLAAAFDPYEMSASGLTISEDGAYVRCQTASHSHAYLNVGFKEGRWAWEFLIAEDITNDESICLGAGTKPVSSSSYNSSPNLWMYRCYNGNLYRKGGQLSGVSKERVHPGDTVRVELDHEQHTLRYILNGERDQGVCFTDVSGEIFPAIAFYGANRAVRLVAVEAVGPSPGPGMRVYPPADLFKRRKWAGEMAAGLRHGFGRLAYAHGKGEWVGTWKQDRQHGLHAWVPTQGGAEAMAIHVFEADSRKRLATEQDIAAAVREWDGWRCGACGFVSRRRHEACFCCGGAKAAVAVTEEPSTVTADCGAGGVDLAAAEAAALQALLATREGCCAAVMSRLASLGALYDRPVGEGDGDVSAAAGAATAAGGVVVAAGAGAGAATGGGAGGEGAYVGGSVVIPPPPPTAGPSSSSPSSFPSVAATPSPNSSDGGGGGGGGTATATEPLTLPFCAEPNAEVFALLHALVTRPAHKRTRRRRRREQGQEEVQRRIVLAALRLLRTNFDRLALAHVDPADVGIDVHADAEPSATEEEESSGGGLASLYPLRRTLEALMSGEGEEEGDNGLGQAAAEALAAGMEILYPDTRVRCALLGQLLRAHIAGEGSDSRPKERLRPLSGRATLLDRVLRRFGTNEGVVALLPTEEEAGGSSHSAASVEEATALLARLFDALALEKRRELAALVDEGPAGAAAAASGFAETMAALLSAYLRQLLSISANGGAATRRTLVRFARMTLAHCHVLVDAALDAAIRGSLAPPAIEAFLHTTLVGQLLPLLGTAAPLLGHELWFAAPLAPLVAGVIQRLDALNARMPGARAADTALRQQEREAAKGRWVSLGQRSEVLSAAFDPREHSEDVSIEDGGRLFRSAASSNQHALANVGFKSGRAAWEFRLESDSTNDECSALGAAVKPVASSSYESCPNMWMRRSYNGQLYHGTSAGYGALSKVHPGDVVRVEVDLDAHTLSFKRNGEEEGVAFTDLEGEVFPAVCTYRAGIEVRLLKVEAWSGEAEGLQAQDPLALRFDGRRGRAPPVWLAKVDECDNAFAHVDRERDEQWATAVTTRALPAASGARHVWEVCVRRCSKAMLAVGVCAGKGWGSQAAEAQVGIPPGSWAWRTDGTLWAHGEQVAGGYGSGGTVEDAEEETGATAAAGPGAHLLTDGDVVTVTLDTAAGTLAFAVDGRDLGLAFGPLGSGAAAEGPTAAVLLLGDGADAAGGELYPAVSLKHAGDRVAIRPAGTVGTVALPWLLDLEHTLAAAGALLAGTATAGPRFSAEEMHLSKWAASPLLVSPPVAVVAPPAAAVAEEEEEDGSDGDGDVEEAAGLEVDGLRLQELLGKAPTASQEAICLSSRRTGRKRPLPTPAATVEADGTTQQFLSLLGLSFQGQPQQQPSPPSSAAARLAKWLDSHGGGRITKRLCEAYPELAAAETACLAALCCAAGVAGEALVGVLERKEGAPLPAPSERARRCGKRMQELRMALIRKHQALKEEQARREAAADEAAMAMAAAAAAVVGAAGKGEGDDDEEEEKKVEDETLTVVPAHHRGGQPSGDGGLLSSSIGSSNSIATAADASPLLLPSSSSASLDDSGASVRSGRTAVLRFAPSARVDLLRTDSMDSAVSPGTPLAMMEEELRMACETTEVDADDMAARARVGRPWLPLPPTAAVGGGGLPQRHRASSSASSYLSLSGGEATTAPPPQHQPPQPHTVQAFVATANALLAKATFVLKVLAEHPSSTGKSDDARLQACAELLLAQDLQDGGQLQQLLARRRARAACRRHGLRCYRALIHATSELPSVQAHAIAHLRAAMGVRALLPTAAAVASGGEGQQQREQEGERPAPAVGGAIVSQPAAAAPMVGSGHHYLAGLEGIPPQLGQAVRRDFMGLYSSLLALATRALQRQHVPLACKALAAWALDFRPAGGQDAGFLLRAGLPSHLARLLSLPRLARCLAPTEEKPSQQQQQQQQQQQWVVWPLRDVRAGLSQGRLTKRVVLAHMLAHSSMEEEDEGIDALVSRLSVGEVVRRYERLLRQVAADRQSEAAALLRQEAEAKAMARRARGVRYTYVVTATNGVGVRRLPDTAAERTGHSYKQHEVVEVSYRLRLSSGQTYLKLAHPQTHGHVGRGAGGGGWVFDVGVRGSYKDRSIMRCIAAEPHAEAEEAKAAGAATTAPRLRAGVGKAGPLVEVAPPALHGDGRSSGAGRLVDIPASAPNTAYYKELAGGQLALVCGQSVRFPLFPSPTSKEDDPSYYEVTVRCTGAEGDVCVGLFAVELTGEKNGKREVELALEEAPPGYTRRSCGLHARDWGVWADGTHVRSYPLAVPPPSSSLPPSTVGVGPTAAAAPRPRRLASAAEAWGANADPLSPRLDFRMPPHEGGTSPPSALTTLRRRLALSALRGGDALGAARAAAAAAAAGASRSGNSNGNAQENGGGSSGGGFPGRLAETILGLRALVPGILPPNAPLPSFLRAVGAGNATAPAPATASTEPPLPAELTAYLEEEVRRSSQQQHPWRSPPSTLTRRGAMRNQLTIPGPARRRRVSFKESAPHPPSSSTAIVEGEVAEAKGDGEGVGVMDARADVRTRTVQQTGGGAREPAVAEAKEGPSLFLPDDEDDDEMVIGRAEEEKEEEEEEEEEATSTCRLPPLAEGDVLGCGVDRPKALVFFTHNGRRLPGDVPLSRVAPEAFHEQEDSSSSWSLVPLMSLHSHCETIEANFGPEFVYRPDAVVETPTVVAAAEEEEMEEEKEEAEAPMMDVDVNAAMTLPTLLLPASPSLGLTSFPTPRGAEEGGEEGELMGVGLSVPELDALHATALPLLQLLAVQGVELASAAAAISSHPEEADGRAAARPSSNGLAHACLGLLGEQLRLCAGAIVGTRGAVEAGGGAAALAAARQLQRAEPARVESLSFRYLLQLLPFVEAGAAAAASNPEDGSSPPILRLLLGSPSGSDNGLLPALFPLLRKGSPRVQRLSLRVLRRALVATTPQTADAAAARCLDGMFTSAKEPKSSLANKDAPPSVSSVGWLLARISRTLGGAAGLQVPFTHAYEEEEEEGEIGAGVGHARMALACEEACLLRTLLAQPQWRPTVWAALCDALAAGAPAVEAAVASGRQVAVEEQLASLRLVESKRSEKRRTTAPFSRLKQQPQSPQEQEHEIMQPLLGTLAAVFVLADQDMLRMGGAVERAVSGGGSGSNQQLGGVERFTVVRYRRGDAEVVVTEDGSSNGSSSSGGSAKPTACTSAASGRSSPPLLSLPIGLFASGAAVPVPEVATPRLTEELTRPLLAALHALLTVVPSPPDSENNDDGNPLAGLLERLRTLALCALRTLLAHFRQAWSEPLIPSLASQLFRLALSPVNLPFCPPTARLEARLQLLQERTYEAVALGPAYLSAIPSRERASAPAAVAVMEDDHDDQGRKPLYRVVLKEGAVVRAGVSIDASERVRVLKAGAVVEVLEACTATGVRRLRIEDGWISERCHGGAEDVIVERVTRAMADGVRLLPPSSAVGMGKGMVDPATVPKQGVKHRLHEAPLRLVTPASLFPDAPCWDCDHCNATFAGDEARTAFASVGPGNMFLLCLNCFASDPRAFALARGLPPPPPNPAADAAAARAQAASNGSGSSSSSSRRASPEALDGPWGRLGAASATGAVIRAASRRRGATTSAAAAAAAGGGATTTHRGMLESAAALLMDDLLPNHRALMAAEDGRSAAGAGTGAGATFIPYGAGQTGMRFTLQRRGNGSGGSSGGDRPLPLPLITMVGAPAGGRLDIRTPSPAGPSAMTTTGAGAAQARQAMQEHTSVDGGSSAPTASLGLARGLTGAPGRRAPASSASSAASTPSSSAASSSTVTRAAMDRLTEMGFDEAAVRAAVAAAFPATAAGLAPGMEGLEQVVEQAIEILTSGAMPASRRRSGGSGGVGLLVQDEDADDEDEEEEEEASDGSEGSGGESESEEEEEEEDDSESDTEDEDAGGRGGVLRGSSARSGLFRRRYEGELDDEDEEEEEEEDKYAGLPFLDGYHPSRPAYTPPPPAHIRLNPGEYHPSAPVYIPEWGAAAAAAAAASPLVAEAKEAGCQSSTQRRGRTPFSPPPPPSDAKPSRSDEEDGDMEEEDEMACIGTPGPRPSTGRFALLGGGGATPAAIATGRPPWRAEAKSSNGNGASVDDSEEGRLLGLLARHAPPVFSSPYSSSSSTQPPAQQQPNAEPLPNLPRDRRPLHTWRGLDAEKLGGIRALCRATGCPPSLCRAALELAAGDEGVARRWLGVHGHRYLPRAGRAATMYPAVFMTLGLVAAGPAEADDRHLVELAALSPPPGSPTATGGLASPRGSLLLAGEEEGEEKTEAFSAGEGASGAVLQRLGARLGQGETEEVLLYGSARPGAGAGGRRASSSSGSAPDAVVGGNVPAAAGGGAAGVGVGAAVAAGETGPDAASRHELMFEEAVLEPLEVERRSACHKVVVGLVCTRCRYLEFPGCSQHAQLLSVRKPNGHGKCARCSCATDLHSPWDKGCRVCRAPTDKCFWAMTVRETQFLLRAFPPACRTSGEDSCEVHILRCPDCNAVGFPGVCSSSESEDEGEERQQQAPALCVRTAAGAFTVASPEQGKGAEAVVLPPETWYARLPHVGGCPRRGGPLEEVRVRVSFSEAKYLCKTAANVETFARYATRARRLPRGSLVVLTEATGPVDALLGRVGVVARYQEDEEDGDGGDGVVGDRVTVEVYDEEQGRLVPVNVPATQARVLTHMFGEELPFDCESEEKDSSSSSSSSSSLATLRRLSGATAGMLAARYAREALVWTLSHWSPHHPPTPAALGITSWRPFIQLFKYVGLAERAFASGPAPAGGRAFDAVLAPVSPASALAEAASAELSSALIEEEGGQGQVQMQVQHHHHHTQGLRLASLSAVLKRQVALWLRAGAESHPYFYADGGGGGGAGAASGRSTPTFASHGPDSLFQALLTDSLENLYSIALGQTLTAAETSEAPPSSLVGGGDRPPFPPKPALPLPLLPPPPPPTLRRASSSTTYATYHIPPPSPPPLATVTASVETEEAAAAVAAAGPILVRQSLHPFFGPCSYGEEVRLPGAGSLRVTLDARTALGPLGSAEATLSFWRSEDEPRRGVRPFKRFPGKHWRGLLQQQQQAQQNGGIGAVGPLISFVVPHSDRLYYAFEARHGPPSRPSSSSSTSSTATTTTGSRGSRAPALQPTRLELEPTNPCRDDYALDKEGTLVRCLGGFPSLAPKEVLLTSGKWYYEVTMVKAGLAQLGWADARFTGHSARGEGVGDDTHSWGLDGHRVYKWHGGGVRWGSKWADGDVLGFAADVDRRTLSFSLNGEWGAPMGLAFEDVSFSEGLRPCLTLNKSCAFVVNFGADCGKHPLRYKPPPGHRPVAEAPRDLALRRTYWGYRFEVAGAVGLQTKPAAEFKLLWLSTSSGSGTHEEAGGGGGGCAIWRPKAGSGHALFGDVVTLGGGAKPGATLVVADDDSPYLAPPRGYKRVLTLEAAATAGGNGTLQGCLWQPLPPDGFVALGDVFAPGHTEPELGLVRCLRRDAVEPAPLYRRARVWRGATDDGEEDAGGVSSGSATASSARATLWGVGNGCGTFVVTRGFGAPGSEGFVARGWRLRPSLPGAALQQDWASEPEAAGAPSMEWALWVLDCFLEACAPWELTAGGILAGRTYEALVRCIVDAPACTDRTRAPAASLLTRLLRTRRSLLLGGMLIDDDMGSGGLPLLSRRALAELPASVKALGRVSPDLLRLCRARVQAQGRLFLPRDLQQVVELVTTINWGLPNAMALLHPLTTAPAAAATASNTRALLAGSLLRRVARGDRPTDEEALVDLIALVEFFSSSSEDGMAESLQAPPFCATTLRAWLEACGAARVVETAHPLPSPPQDNAPAAIEVDGGEVSLEGAEFVEVVFDGRSSLQPGVTLSLTGGNPNAGAAPVDWDAGTGLITWRSGDFATRLLFRGPRLRWSLTAGGDAAVVAGAGAGGSSSGAGKRKRGGARGRGRGEDGEGGEEEEEEEEEEEQDLLASLSQRIDRLALHFEGTETALPPRRLLPTAAVSVDDHIPTSRSSGDSSVSAWGVGFTVLTKRLSPATRLRQLQEADSSREGGLLAAFPRFGASDGGGEGKWSMEHDAAIVEWLNAAAEALGREGVEVSPFDFRHGGGDTTMGLQLRDAAVPLIYLRIALIQGFNRLVRQLLPLLDLGNACRHSLGHRLRGLTHLVLKDVKMAVVEAGKERTQGTGGNALTITLDNFAASRSMEAGETSIRTSRCIFVQAFRALHHKDPKLLRSCWDGDRVFQVTFRGENGSDAGGVFREGMSRVVEDLHNPAALSLLTPCPNARHGLPTNVDKSLPNQRLAGCPLAGAMLEFVGKLMGMSLRAHLCLPFQFPSLVWKRLLGQELTFRGDMQAVDTLTCRLLDSVRACTTPEDFEAKFGGCLTFVVTGHDGAEMELFPGGGAECVVFETRERYCDLLADYHLHEYDGQIQAIARGLYALVPRDTLLLLTWRELETLVCGSPSFDLAFWRRHTTYSGYTEGDITVQLFWKVLASLTEEEQSGFVRFAWGRSRLPPKHAWFKDMQISRRNTGEDSLPASHTCFFSIELPPYKTEAAMRKGLLTAIHYGMVGILNT